MFGLGPKADLNEARFDSFADATTSLPSPDDSSPFESRVNEPKTDLAYYLPQQIQMTCLVQDFLLDRASTLN